MVLVASAHVCTERVSRMFILVCEGVFCCLCRASIWVGVLVFYSSMAIGVSVERGGCLV